MPVYPARLVYPPISGGINVTLQTSQGPLDGANEYLATVVQLPKSGSLTHVWFAFGSIAVGTTPGSEPTVGLETVSATDGFPTGSPYGGSAPALLTFAGTDDYAAVRLALGTPANAVAGDVVAIVVRNPAANPPNFTLNSGGQSIGHGDQSAAGLPYKVANTGTPTKAYSYLVDVILEYATGWLYVPFCGLPDGSAQVSFNSGSTPSKRGAQMILPFRARVAGIRILVDADAPFNAVLYSASGAVLRTAPFADADQRGYSGPSIITLPFDPIWLDPHVPYYAMVQPSSVTNIIVGRSTIYNPTGDWDQARSAWGGFGMEATGNSFPFAVSSTAVSATAFLIDAIDQPYERPRTRPLRARY